MSHPLKTFICYAHEDHEVVDGLKKQLAIFEKKALLQIWSDGKILAGEHWDNSIKTQLEQAELILLFISVDFINSDYIEKKELQTALQRHRDRLATLIPIIVRPCHWEEYFDIGQFQALPTKARPILSSHFPHRDEAFFEIATGIKKTAEDLRDQKILAVEAQKAQEAAEQEAAAATARVAAAAERQRLKDEAAWKGTLRVGSLEAYEAYLDDGYALHEAEAHQRIQELTEEEAEQKASKKAVEKRLAALAAEAQRAKEAARKKAEQEAAAKLDPFHDLMLPIKGGTFDMGSNDYDSEKPIHKVTVPDFHLCKYPVTQAQWKQIMGENPSIFKGDDLPVEQVSWDDAQAFIQTLNRVTNKAYRLPTEAEWEYAAKGGGSSRMTKYSGSNDLKEVGWYYENSGDKPLSGEWDASKLTSNNCRTHPVGQKKPNELGLYDMSGNVWEWVEDDWHSDFKGAPTDGSAWVERGTRGGNRVYRGGSWYSGPRICRAGVRFNGAPTRRDSSIGLRLSLSSQL